MSARLRRGAVAGWVAAAVGLTVAVSGCSGSHSYTRFTSDACASTLPAAGAAVHGQGRLVTVRPFRRAELQRYFGVAPRPLPSGSPRRAPDPAQPRACLVVFRGPFAAGSVAGADQQAGRFALVLVRVRSPQVLLTRVADDYPPRP